MVLLVEDDSDTAAFYTALLSSEGLEVVSCVNCEQARQWWRNSSRTPDLMVLDMRLPDGNGLELCEGILGPLDNDSRPAVLVLSAHGDPRLPTLSRRAGAHAFLDKLSSVETFLDTTRQLLAASTLRKGTI